MSIYRKKVDISKHLPWASYLFVAETVSAAIHFSYFSGIIKVLNAQLRSSKNKMPAVDV